MATARAGREPLVELAVRLVALIANLLQFLKQFWMDAIVGEIDRQACDLGGALAARRVKRPPLEPIQMPVEVGLKGALPSRQLPADVLLQELLKCVPGPVV